MIVRPDTDKADRPEASESLTYLSECEEETQAFARFLGSTLPAGSLIALTGELGSGKTCFVRGLAEGLGINPERVRSPTFTLINEYGGGRLPLYHIDLYRLEVADMDSLGLWEYLEGDGLCAVEWFERLGEETSHLAVHLTFVAESRRKLVAVACGRRYDEVLRALAAEIGRHRKGIGKD